MAMKALDSFKALREQKLFDKAIELIPYAQFLGITFKETPSGLIFALPFTANKIGNIHIPAIHGGVIAGFMENAAIMHLMWTTTSVEVPKSINFTIDYNQSARPQDTYAICHVKKMGKRVANVQIEAWQDDRKNPVAIARSHFKLSSNGD
jgi:uncharacterized protein (TIGR00369 family)